MIAIKRIYFRPKFSTVSEVINQLGSYYSVTKLANYLPLRLFASQLFTLLTSQLAIYHLGS